MTELDEELLPLAAELIDEYGASILFGVIEPGVYNVATGKAVPLDETKPIKALIESAANIRNSDLIQGARYRLTIAGTTLSRAPKPGQDVAIVHGELCRVLDPVSKTYSGDEVAIYSVQVGK